MWSHTSRSSGPRAVLPSRLIYQSNNECRRKLLQLSVLCIIYNLCIHDNSNSQIEIDLLLTCSRKDSLSISEKTQQLTARLHKDHVPAMLSLKATRKKKHLNVYGHVLLQHCHNSTSFFPVARVAFQQSDLAKVRNQQGTTTFGASVRFPIRCAGWGFGVGLVLND